MSLILHPSNIVEVTAGNPLFVLTDGIAIAHRASIRVSEDCPAHCRDILHSWYEAGWITPVANMYDFEMTFTTLKTL